MDSQNNLLNEMAGDAAKTEANPDSLKRLAELVRVMRETEKEVEEATKKLAEKQKALAAISEQQIPDLFDGLGLSELKLDTGEKVEIKRGYAANISAEREAAAFAWLREHRHGAIIKHEVAVSLKKEDAELYKPLTEFLNEKGFTYSDKESIHANTLKSFVTEQMGLQGSNLPTETFGVFPLRKTKIS